MKLRQSIAVDRALLKKADRLSRRYRTRTQLVEAALRGHLARLARQDAQDGELDRINQLAHDLNKEARDVLDYQIAL